MAGWSIVSEGSSFDFFQILCSLQRKGFWLDFESTDCLEGSVTVKYKIKVLFDRFLSVFLSKAQLPLPAMVKEGQAVDLFKLYCAVTQRGGYDSVTTNGLWGNVAEVSGFARDVGSSVRLVYVKYLNILDRWLQSLKVNCTDEDRAGRLEISSLVELEAEVNKLFDGLSEWKKTAGDCAILNQGGSKVSMPADDGKQIEVMIVDSDSDDTSVERNEEENRSPVLDTTSKSSLKRKRENEPLANMLNWLSSIAKSPGETPNRIYEGFIEEECEVQKYWAQALSTREVLLLRRPGCLNPDRSLLPKKQRMHPSMYEDFTGSRQDGSRCGSRVPSARSTPPSTSWSETSASTDSDFEKPLTPSSLEPAKRVLRTTASLNAQRLVGLLKDHVRKRVPVGPFFQAEVPCWTGPSACTSDEARWLGTQHWPPKPNPYNTLIQHEPIGRGRPDTCGCKYPGSVECVRLHIMEKRANLSRELGPTFCHWKFHQIGEEVSFSWTEDEEQRFKEIIRSNPPSLLRSFWEPVYLSFPSKSRKNLASYYFNVFLIRRRSYQNRVTPMSIDSDDDESDFELLGGTFGHELASGLESTCTTLRLQNKQCKSSTLCRENKQCQSLDDSMEMD